ncbi:MAG TPA: DUF6220 domain-containing protein [Baekduia sp.]|nr:DUF6220 domain-containing protein [Baekduia sp.]
MSTSTSTAAPAGSRRLRLALAGLFLLGVAVQFYLAGRGAFGASGGYDAHKAVGDALHGISLIILIATVAVPATRNRVDVGLAVALFVLMTIQVAIATFSHPELGALHPFNALLVTGAAAGMFSRDRRLGTVATPRPLDA